MKSSSRWLVLWAVWLLVCACGAPRALSPAGVGDSASESADTLEASRPPPRPPPTRTAQQPGRGGRNRGRAAPQGRGQVFNAEPTREQREAARRRRRSAADEQLLRERYWKWKAEAERLYPGKVGLYQEHHFWPIFLGGLRNGKTFRLPAPYHQLITNAFREEHPYGRPPPGVEEARRIMLKVYSKYPIPQLIGIQDP
jgi:hypothetical protein